MAYTTVAELAARLKIRVTPDNQDMLQACIDAAAREIDHFIDLEADSPAVDPADPLAGQVNVARAVEWFKSTDSTYGTVGYLDVGTLVAPRARNTFERHMYNLIPLKQQWGAA